MRTLHNTIIMILLSMALAVGMAGCKSSDSDDGTGTSGTGGTGGTTPTDPTDPTPPKANLGLSDHDSFSLSVEKLNVEGWDVDGNTTTLTVRLAGNLNDKTVLDGEEVVFSTEGGRILGSCILANGDCSVEWNSQEPRPIDGRVSIVAWTDGFESFDDKNANGLYDDGDLFPAANDLGEPFQDNNENGVYDAAPANDRFFDFIGAATANAYDGPDGMYNGAACAHSTNCSPVQSVFIFRQAVITMSGSGAFFDFSLCSGGPLPDPLVLVGKTSRSICVRIYDTNNNPLPVGTKIEAVSGATNQIFGDTVINTNAVGGTTSEFEITGTETGDPFTLRVKTTTPGGFVTHSSSINITDSPKPAP